MLFGSKSINLSEYLKAKRGISIVYFITKMMGDSGQGNLFLWFAIFFSAAFAIVFPNHSGSVTVNSESVLLDYKIADANSDLGDINNDDRIDLRDALIGLKVVSGDTANVANPTADVNNDGRIGLEDVLYIFRIIGEGGEGAVHQ